MQQLSIERIAREAGVSKTTIFRWWPNRAVLIIDTFLENHILSTPVREDLPAIDAIREHVAALATVYAGSEGRLIAQLIAECQYDTLTLDEFKKHFWGPRRESVKGLVERAISEGSIRHDRGADEIAERIYAPIYFRLLFQEGSLDARCDEGRIRARSKGSLRAEPSALGQPSPSSQRKPAGS